MGSNGTSPISLRPSLQQYVWLFSSLGLILSHPLLRQCQYICHRLHNKCCPDIDALPPSCPHMLHQSGYWPHPHVRLHWLHPRHKYRKQPQQHQQSSCHTTVSLITHQTFQSAVSFQYQSSRYKSHTVPYSGQRIFPTLLITSSTCCSQFCVISRAISQG